MKKRAELVKRQIASEFDLPAYPMAYLVCAFRSLAQRFFWAALMRARASADIVRGFLPSVAAATGAGDAATAAFARGRPRLPLVADEPVEGPSPMPS